MELLAIQHDNNSLQYERLNIERERLDIDRRVGSNLMKMISNHLMWEEKMFEHIFHSGGRADSLNKMMPSNDNNYCNAMPGAGAAEMHHTNESRAMTNNTKSNSKVGNETAAKTITDKGKPLKASNATTNTNVSAAEPRPHTSKSVYKYAYGNSPKQVQNKRCRTRDRSIDLDHKEQEFKADHVLKKESGQSLSSHLSDISNSD